MRWIEGLAVLGLFAGAVTDADAAPIACGEHDTMETRLNVEFDEQRIGYGVDARGMLVELFSDAEAGSWSVLITRADGVSCLVAVGDAWQNDPEPRPSAADFGPSY